MPIEFLSVANFLQSLYPSYSRAYSESACRTERQRQTASKGSAARLPISRLQPSVSKVQRRDFCSCSRLSIILGEQLP